MTLAVGFLTLYLFYDLSNNVLEKITRKFEKLEADIEYCNNEIALLNSIILDIDRLNIGLKPIKELSEMEINARDEKLSKLQVILDTYKKTREVSKLTIDVELTKKMN